MPIQSQTHSQRKVKKSRDSNPTSHLPSTNQSVVSNKSSNEYMPMSVWQKIKSGHLLARIIHNHICVFDIYQKRLQVLDQQREHKKQSSDEIIQSRLDRLEKLYKERNQHVNVNSEPIERSLPNTRLSSIEKIRSETSKQFDQINNQLIRLRQENEDLRMLNNTLIKSPYK